MISDESACKKFKGPELYAKEYIRPAVTKKISEELGLIGTYKGYGTEGSRVLG